VAGSPWHPSLLSGFNPCLQKRNLLKHASDIVPAKVDQNEIIVSHFDHLKTRSYHRNAHLLRDAEHSSTRQKLAKHAMHL
jgi:hypothetical protein